MRDWGGGLSGVTDGKAECEMDEGRRLLQACIKCLCVSDFGFTVKKCLTDTVLNWKSSFRLMVSEDSVHRGSRAVAGWSNSVRTRATLAGFPFLPFGPTRAYGVILATGRECLFRS